MQHKSIHSSACIIFHFSVAVSMLMPFQTPVGSMKWNSAVLKGKNIGKNLYYTVHLGTICSCRPIPLIPYFTKQRTFISSQPDMPLNTSDRQNCSSLSADTNCLLNSKSQWLAEIKQEHSREVPAKDQQRISNCAEILSGWSSTPTSSQQLQFTMTSLCVPLYQDCGSGWKWG